MADNHSQRAYRHIRLDLTLTEADNSPADRWWAE